MPRNERDSVDRIAAQWRALRPDIDISPMEVIGRVSRLSRLIDKALTESFARFGIESWMYDVLATLRRAGEPYQLTAGELVGQSMVTTGAITNRIDRLEERGLVTRTTGEDRRKVFVRLTTDGFDLVEAVVGAHMDAERTMLASLSPRQQRELANLLRAALLTLGDRAAD